MAASISFYSDEFLCENCLHHMRAHYDDERGNRYCMACGGGKCQKTTSEEIPFTGGR